MIDFTKDSHIHTSYSPDADAKATFNRYIKKAQEIGLTELTFTDHVDFDAVHPLFHNMINYSIYIKQFNEIKKDSPIPIRLGVEIGYQKHTKDDISKFLQMYPFEHVILSIHYIERKDLYTGEYFLGKSKREAYSIYFDTCIEAITEFPNVNAFGHLDYIIRYSNMGDYIYQDYKKQIDTILELLIKKNIALEINTSGFLYDKRQYPKNEVIRRYIELGGNLITLGSDAHNVEQLGRHFETIKRMMNNT